MELAGIATRYAVRIAVEDGQELVGSGVLYVTGKTAFVWTVAHVVDRIMVEERKERQIRLSFYNPFLEDTHHYQVLELQAILADDTNKLAQSNALIYKDPNYKKEGHIRDVAIIQIPWQPYMNNLVPLNGVELIDGSKVLGVGFPSSMNNEWKKDSENELAGRKCFEADINNSSTEEGFNIVVKGTQYEDDVTRETVMEGFSGSGIYSNNALSKGIVGLISKPVGVKSAGNMVSCTKTCWYIELMRKFKLVEEIPNSFEQFVDIFFANIGNNVIPENKKAYVEEVIRNSINISPNELSFDKTFEKILACEGRRHACNIYWVGQLKRIMIFSLLGISKSKCKEYRVEKYKIAPLSDVGIEFLCSEDRMENIVHNIKRDKKVKKKNTIFICNGIDKGIRDNRLTRKECMNVVADITKGDNYSRKNNNIFSIIHGDRIEENIALLGIDRLVQKVIDEAPNEREVKKKVKIEVKEVW